MKWVLSELGDWVDEFLPSADLDEQTHLDKLVFEPFDIDMSKEAAMYPDLADMFNEYLGVIGCTDFVVRYTDSYKDMHTPGSVESCDYNPLKPDLAFLPTTAEAKKAYEIDQRAREKKRGKRGKMVASRQAGGDAAPSTAGRSSVQTGPLPQPVFTPLSSIQVPPPDMNTHFSNGEGPVSAIHHDMAGPGVPGAPPGPRSMPQSVLVTSSAQPSNAHTSADALPTAPIQPSGSAATSTTVPPADTTATDTSNGSLASSNARMTWAWAEVVVEVKHGSRRYPFIVSDFLSSASERKAARGQLADYASEIFRRQHREFVFVISICDATVRFLRFDRGGAVVSRSFNYITHPRLMGVILYRIFGPGTNRVSRGHDPTATLAEPIDSDLFRGLLVDPVYQANTTLLAALRHAATENWPIYKIEIPFQWPGGSEQLPARRKSSYPVTTREFLVGRPMFSSSSMTGRGTKCMVAYDKTAKKLVLIKDIWRPDSARLQTELETYQHLWEGADSVKATHIPTCLGGGDVTHDGQVRRTRTQKYLGEQGHLPRIHSRIVLKEICRRLVDFKTPIELAIGVFNAVEAHERAWKRGILHRDVSVGNILLLDLDGGRVMGLLADWDLAKTKEQLEDFSPTQTFRSGTWQFMSAQLQKYMEKRHEVSDDLESFIHVLDWCAFKYLPHDLSSQPHELAFLVHTLYDGYLTHDNVDGGGLVYKGHFSKFHAAMSFNNIVTGLKEDHPFTQMLGELHALCGKHYALTRPRLPQPQTVTSQTVTSMERSSMLDEQDGLDRFMRVLEDRMRPSATSGVPLSSSSSSVEAQTGIVATQELSPLHDHTHFIYVMGMACALGRSGGWPIMEKNLTQARLLPVTTNTPLASRFGSKRTMDSVGSDDSRPHKRQKIITSAASDDETDGEDPDEDPFALDESGGTVHESGSADGPTRSELAREYLNRFGIRASRKKHTPKGTDAQHK